MLFIEGRRVAWNDFGFRFAALFDLGAKGFVEGITIGSKLAQIDLVTSHRMFGQILDLELHLRLADFFLASRFVQVAERFPARAQIGFHVVYFRQAGGARIRNFRDGGFRGGKGRARFLDRSFGFGALGALLLAPRLITGDVGMAGRDQFGQLCMARGHRLTLAAQAFMALALGRNGKPQLTQLFSQFIIPHPFGFDCRLQRGLAFARIAKERSLVGSFAVQLGEPCGGSTQLLIERASFPIERIMFAACLVPLAFDRCDLLRRC